MLETDIKPCKTMILDTVVSSIDIDDPSTCFNNIKPRLVCLYISLINDFI